ncbi:MAG: hypothetical protein NC932_02035 [Candidatus Omnitrophica bacterium]|nr:hypothetical protein [Candidatus Omnitrophota bacterium]
MNIRKFQNPPVIMRPSPFWAINDRIIPEETARQMDDMLSVGLSGVFFHSRAGLITEYMGKDWFDAIRAVLEVYKRKDGYLWLYDEDKWPSGNAGGYVAAIKDEYRAAYLYTVLLQDEKSLPPLKEKEKVKYGYKIVKREGLILEDFEVIPGEDVEKVSGERLIVVRGYSPKTPWWNGESYSNLLNPEVVQEFIRLTYERYYEHLGEEFGKRIPGIFTDEPHIVPPVKSGIPWYEGIPERYKEWTGRDFWADLPYLYFDGTQARYIRLLIHRTLLKQFIEAYSKALYEWCEKHNIAYTGHYLCEDTFSSQIRANCGSVMAHYKYQQIPGIDHLCRQIDKNIPILLTAKQVSSAARQLGRKNVLSEIFGVSRHTNTFQDFKWLGDFDLVHGITFFCPHLSWYSGKGRRKRDYPPVWNYQQTYWKELPALNDYFTRIAVALTSGKPDVKILLLHSIESAIAGRRIGVISKKTGEDIPADDMGDAELFDTAMRKTLEIILNTGYDCDLGDENFIEDVGDVRGKNFIIGKMSYKIVIIPPSCTWREKTAFLLERFIENGGVVIILGKPPEEIDGIENKERWQKILLRRNVYPLPNSVEAIQNIISSLHPSTYKLQGIYGEYYTKTYIQHRIDGKEEIFFIVNSDKENEREYILKIENAGKRRLLKWDPVNGETCLADTKKEKDALVYQFSLPPAGSILLTLSSFSGNIKREKKLPDLNNADIIYIPSTFEFERKDDNVLVLDRISVSYDGINFEKEVPDWRVRKIIAEHFGVKDTLAWQPWVSIKKGLFEGKGGDIVLRYKFISDLERPNAYLVIEDMQKGRVFVNGKEVYLDEENLSWHWDRSFKKIRITEYVKKGENTLDFKVKYDFLTEVEPAYIVGDFGVELINPYQGKIIKEKKTLRGGSWVNQGYPFYSGSMVYKSTFHLTAKRKKVFVRILKPSGTLFKIKVNGEDAGNILWSPYILEITRFVKKGGNSISVEVVSSLQNSWGPLHENDGDDNMWCGPEAFEDENFIREEFSLFNYGIEGIEIISF